MIYTVLGFVKNCLTILICNHEYNHHAQSMIFHECNHCHVSLIAHSKIHAEEREERRESLSRFLRELTSPFLCLAVYIYIYMLCLRFKFNSN